MGGEQSVDESTDNVIINHPKFREIKYIRDKDIIRTTINIDHEDDFYRWEDKLNSVTDLDDEVILLPKAYTYAKKAVCGSAGVLNVQLWLFVD